MDKYIYKTFTHEQTGKKIVVQFQKEGEHDVLNFSTGILQSEEEISAAMNGDMELFQTEDWQWTERINGMIESKQLVN